MGVAAAHFFSIHGGQNSFWAGGSSREQLSLEGELTWNVLQTRIFHIFLYVLCTVLYQYTKIYIYIYIGCYLLSAKLTVGDVLIFGQTAGIIDKWFSSASGLAVRCRRLDLVSRHRACVTVFFLQYLQYLHVFETPQLLWGTFRCRNILGALLGALQMNITHRRYLHVCRPKFLLGTGSPKMATI